jgi:hypothetical protein
MDRARRRIISSAISVGKQIRFSREGFEGGEGKKRLRGETKISRLIFDRYGCAEPTVL